MSAPTVPEVTIHYAQTIDGRIATRTGQSKWISCPETLTYAHQLRARHDAILVGAGTIVADNPRLTVRRVEGPSPRRVVLDSRLRIPLSAAVLNDPFVERTLVITTAQAPLTAISAVRARGADVEIADADCRGLVDLMDALCRLARRGVQSVLVEGGSQTITSFLRDRLVSRISICIAPIILGEGVSAIGDLGIGTLDAAWRCQSVQWRRIGADLVIEARL